VRRKADSVGAAWWVEELPELVASLEQEWSIRVGRPYADATEAFVAEATLDDGASAVLKLVIPRDDDAARNEATALRLAAGVGCVQLLRQDMDRGALLLERLGRSLYELGFALDRRHEILCDTAARLWRPAPECGLPTGLGKGLWLIDYITTSEAVLVHGDVHQWNTLEASNGFKLVDPDGLLAEPEYDLGIIMREDPLELLDGDPHERARWLAARTGLDAAAIWEWGVVERVSTGLLCTKIGLQPMGRDMLATADQITG
jgi:streptomycin 6-kinase